MHPAKRLIRAPWPAIVAPLFVLVLLVAGVIWGLFRLLFGERNPSIKWTIWIVIVVIVLLIVVLIVRARMTILLLAIAVPKLRASIPRLETSANVAGLGDPVSITFDQFGVPTIKAKSRLDAMRALGYVTARDRLFQMDLLRRAAAGRLTEIFGKGLLKMDTTQRIVGCNRVAPAVVERLPSDQREVLEAYAEGVNAFITQMKARPFEYLLLRVQPELWSSESSVLALLQMFQNLSAEEEGKRRMLATMEATLPEEITAFLTPEDGPYTTLLGWGQQSHRPVRSLPRAELASLTGREDALAAVAGSSEPVKKIVKTEGMASGSNCWAVDNSKTINGAAMLSNDMHTGLNVPNLWYRTRLVYDGVDLCGVVIPGIPMVLAGSNTHIAWGLTNMLGACLDLIPLEIDSDRPDEYLTPDGPRPFEVIKEPIKLKRGDFVDTEVKTTIWGPVIEKTLMGKPVARRWTALDPESVNFGLMNLERVNTVEDAVKVINRFAGPPLNVVVADERGRIAYTLCGRFPARNGGATAAAGSAWTSYLEPDQLPRIVESVDGFLVNANNMSVGIDYPYLLGEGFPHSYRAYRIAQRLREMSKVNEADMFTLQSDTVCEIYEFYRRLALEALPDRVVASDRELAVVRDAIRAWDGRAGLESYGLIFLTYFRESLAQSVFTPIVKVCAGADEDFVYAWPNLDTPLRIMLTERPPELLGEHATWEDFLASNMKGSVAELKETTRTKSVANLNWGKFSKAEIYHPFAQKDRSLAGKLLNMPEDSLPGCIFSVCSSEPGYGASVRMVVTPGRESDGILHIACGQSGHPLSENYDDQNEYWARHRPLEFLPGPTKHILTLGP